MIRGSPAVAGLYVTGFPLSLGNVHFVDLPSIFAFSRGNRPCTLNMVPVRNWHELQWHKVIRSGSGPL